MKEISLETSKSMLNRLLIMGSFSHNLPTVNSRANDVVDLHKALEDLTNNQTQFHIRDGGTTLRFLIARLSREDAEFQINADTKLLSRPHEELLQTLSLLGVEVNKTNDCILTKSSGWKTPNKELHLDCSKSSQFASSILLSSINLPFDLNIQLENLDGSFPYFAMTAELLKNSGIQLEYSRSHFSIAKNQTVKSLPSPEIDLSSAFAIAAMHLSEGCLIKNFPKQSLQADFYFLDIFRKMGIQFEFINDDLKIFPQNHNLKPINEDLSSCPDLFPVLASICATISQPSTLSGLHSLAFKESNRLSKSIELLSYFGVQCIEESGCLKIQGPLNKEKNLTFDPAADHRMAMAAAFLKKQGCKINILTPDVVNKSFPDFWKLCGANP